MTAGALRRFAHGPKHCLSVNRWLRPIHVGGDAVESGAVGLVAAGERVGLLDYLVEDANGEVDRVLAVVLSELQRPAEEGRAATWIDGEDRLGITQGKRIDREADVWASTPDDTSEERVINESIELVGVAVGADR